MNFQVQKIAQVKSIREGERAQFRVCAMLKAIQKKQAKNGAEFIIADFGDNSGSMTVMCFGDSLAFVNLAQANAGEAYFLSGTSDFYNGRFSPKVDSVSKLSDEELKNNIASLIESSPFSCDAMKAELSEIIKSIPNRALRATVECSLAEVGEEFFTSTAAIKMHHAYMHGLLEHSLKLARLAQKLLPIYPFINPSLALAGAILHDIGKVAEYAQDFSSDKTRIGILQGHVVLGYRVVRKAAIKSKLSDDLAERLEHIILSHQGELEWGAAAMAATPEAVFVSMLDNLDARMGAVDNAMRSGSGGEFSEPVPALRTRILLTPPLDESRSRKQIYIATSNAHKVEEFKRMFSDWGIDCDVFSAKDLGGMPPCEENGFSFEENAFLKAETLKNITPENAYVLADDSGIVVDILGGKPGIHSARYSGVEGIGADKANNEKLLQELENVEESKRTARFVCALALICPDGSRESFFGKVEGRINRGGRGQNGFGYDPLFELQGEETTTAELDVARKNQISHRGRALKKLAEFLSLK